MTALPPPKHSKELANAIYDDWKRKVVDDAKKRAVGQAVDYDTFKNMVSVAHLKPIQAPNNPKTDMMLPSWKFGAEGSASSSTSGTPSVALAQQEPSGPPSTSADFLREWRRNCPTAEARYRYLRLCGPPTLASLFKVEINCELLKEMLVVLEGCWLLFAGTAEEGDEGAALQEADFVVQVLQALQSTGRFQLTVKLAGAASGKALRSLFSQLEEAAAAASGGEPNGAGAQDPPCSAKVSAESTEVLRADHQVAGSEEAEGGSRGDGDARVDHGRAIRESLQELRKAYGVQ